MKKTSIVIILLYLLAIPVTALEPERVVYASINWENGKHEIAGTRVIIDYPTETNPNGNYLVKLIDSSNKTLYQLKVLKPVNITPAPPDMNIGEKKKFYEKKGLSEEMSVFLPYLKEAKYLSFEHGTKVLARANLIKLCNENGKCEEPENYLSCPEDCSIKKEDRYCLAEKDGTCDPDCMEGIDPDCKEEKPKPEKLDWVGIGIIAAIIGVVLVILLSKRKK